jgi:hypothetical protein
MRNVWKGLVVGAFAGAAVGVVLDAVRASAKGAARITHHVTDAARGGVEHQ